MAKVVMYTGDHCPFCMRAKMLFDNKGVEYEEINVDQDEGGRQAYFEKTGLKTVPQIYINDELIGGYQEVSAFEATGELDRLLNS